MVNHAGAAPSNALVAGMIALASVALYWYMATTEDERANQAKELKDKADNALEQASGKKKSLYTARIFFFLLIPLYKKLMCFLMCNLPPLQLPRTKPSQRLKWYEATPLFGLFL